MFERVSNDWRLFEYEKLNSSNDFLIEKGAEFKHGDIIYCLEQEKGRGRGSKKWISGKGKGLTFSILLEVEKWEIEKIGNIPQIIALTISEVLKVYNIQSKLKWPNDVLVEEKKIAGILSESKRFNNKKYLISGIGININFSEEELKESINQASCSIYSLTKNYQGIKEVLLQFIHIFCSNFEKLKENGFEIFLEKWKEKSNLIGKKIILIESNKEIIVEDINKNGYIKGRNKIGKEEIISFGEIKYDF